MTVPALSFLFMWVWHLKSHGLQGIILMYVHEGRVIELLVHMDTLYAAGNLCTVTTFLHCYAQILSLT